MSFIHRRKLLEQGDVVVVNCSHQCNVLLTTDENFARYRLRQPFSYRGGHFKQFPVRITVPHTDEWNITIDLAGARANIKYSIDVNPIR